MDKRVRLIRISDNQAITEDSDPGFWLHYQHAILLALKEDGTLTEEQLRHAEAALRSRRRAEREGGKND